MKILVVAATAFEIKPVLQHLGAEEMLVAGKLAHYKNQDFEVIFLVTGVGMTATAYYMGKTLNNTFDYAINAGICGSFDKMLPIGTVVNIMQDCFSELGAEDGDSFLTLEELKLTGVTKIVNRSKHKQNSVIEKLPEVSGITVNTVHGNETNIIQVVQRFNPTTESMEGAAFMLACQEQGVEYTQIRAVSNYVERRNKEKWNIPLAIKNVNEILFAVLNNFEKQTQ